MPRILPPIAPRAPAEPTPPPIVEQTRNVSVQPSDMMDRVRALQRQPARYIAEPNPFTMALWATLNEDTADVLRRHAATMRYALEAHNSPQDSDEPGERQITTSIAAPTGKAIQAVMDATVAAAIQGDSRARDVIASRIEGNPGQRRGDIDPEAERQRMQVRGTIEQIVRDMAERAILRPEPIDVTPTETDDV